MLNLNSKYTNLNQKSDSKKLTRIFFGTSTLIIFFLDKYIVSIERSQGSKRNVNNKCTTGGYKL